MIYILIAVAALLAIAYIVYLVLDFLARRKFAERYTTWEPDIDKCYKGAERSHHATDEDLCKAFNDLQELIDGTRRWRVEP